MPPRKKMPPAPIDRPLSRAYLRKFGGWSTEYPPGASDPTSMRIMENVLVNREGSVRVRPGLRLLTKSAANVPPFGNTLKPVSSHEPFYLNDGRLAYLVAVRNTSTSRVEFRVGILDESGALGRWDVVTLTAAGPLFSILGYASAADVSFTGGTTYVRFLQIDNKILALSNNGEPLIVFHVGATKKVPKYSAIADPPWSPGASRGYIDMPSLAWVLGAQTTYPTHAVDFSSSNSIAQGFTSDANPYNFAFCYTFSSELGETAPSEIAQFKVQRAWGSWLWNAPDTALLGTQTTSPHPTNYTTVGRDASDQLSLNIPNYGLIEAAAAAGATKINFYVMSWSRAASVPVEMELVGSRDLTPASSYASHGWFMMDPSTLGLGPTIPVPTPQNRVTTNTTEPPRAGQGIVAADRLVLVNDPTKAAVIRWTTNAPGENLNLAISRGGGYKTLTSGNMQIPACVKLWQNPQSADTLTILNEGTDGYATTYYMAPATVTSQSDNTLVMGFEETTATPGTTSPYGCEVANNALYHPLDDQLMKSTASNYNITHKSQTDQISSLWRKLLNKQNIVSCFFDQRLYYLVYNPEGAALESGCMGNEVWVLDLATTTGIWSRWLVQGVSLRKTEVKGRSYLSLTRPDGVFTFDPDYGLDDYVAAGAVSTRGIPWRLMTNTQGANRAHDAMSHLQQANLTVGNFTGTLRYGITGLDVHGMRIDKPKLMRAPASVADGLPWDLEDFLLIQRQMKEWFFYAGSVLEADGVTVVPSSGQITLVQYRYTPISVNVGFEYGSVETFEYGNELAMGASANTINGTPQPYIDTARP